MYKVESALNVDSPNAVRIIAVERQSTAEVEVQVWNTIEGTAPAPLSYIIGKVKIFFKRAHFFLPSIR